MSESVNIHDPRKELAISNRWVNSIFTGYGIVKQRILLHIIEDPELQKLIWLAIKGKPTQTAGAGDVLVPMDMSRIVHFNNYYQVRKALTEMSTQDIDYYTGNFKHCQAVDYAKGPLINGFETTKEKRIVNIRIKVSVALLLVKIDKGDRGVPAHFTKFDRETLPSRNSGSRNKYMLPLYLMMCSYANNKNAGFDISIEELRLRLQVEEKYKGFADLNKYVLMPIQEELKRFGKYCFNYSQSKTGKTVKRLTFKIYKNNTPFNYNEIWLKIQHALDGEKEMPYYRRINFDQRQELNYLLTPGKYDLQEVYKKLGHTHDNMVKSKAKGAPIKNVFQYLIKSLHDAFPPG